jgi:hypothetical protein
VAAEALPPYGSIFSKHDFTQHQLFAILVLRQFFKTDYRGIAALLDDLPDLQRTLGLNTLDFVVNDFGQIAGLRVDQLSGTANVPTPASVAVLPIGALWACRRRRCA